MEMAERQKYCQKSKDCTQGNEKVWAVVRNSPLQEVGKSGTAGT